MKISLKWNLIIYKKKMPPRFCCKDTQIYFVNIIWQYRTQSCVGSNLIVGGVVENIRKLNTHKYYLLRNSKMPGQHHAWWSYISKTFYLNSTNVINQLNHTDYLFFPGDSYWVFFCWWPPYPSGFLSFCCFLTGSQTSKPLPNLDRAGCLYLKQKIKCRSFILY